jgi:nucleoside-diphosphate-sugar epimerase
MATIVLGATGFVGGRIVGALIAAGQAVTGFARDARGVERVRALGATPVVGDLQDKAATAELLRRHDAVVWAAQLLMEPEQQVLDLALDALEGSGKTLLMISGTAVLSERTDGAWSEATYAEADPFEPRRQLSMRAETERRVLAGADRGVRALCVRPPLLWGHGGSVVMADLHQSARRTGAVCYIGAGLNAYSNVHVDDLADLVALALEKAPAGALYHCVSGEVPFRMMAEAVAAGRGLPARSVDFAEAEQVWGRAAAMLVFGSSSRSRCPRARDELGWRPRPDRLDFLGECGNPAFAEAAAPLQRAWEARPATR